MALSGGWGPHHNSGVGVGCDRTESFDGRFRKREVEY